MHEILFGDFRRLFPDSQMFDIIAGDVFGKITGCMRSNARLEQLAHMSQYGGYDYYTVVKATVTHEVTNVVKVMIKLIYNGEDK